MTARVLLLGGVDPSGGAGITVDAAVCSALGVVGLPIPIVLTVQSATGFRSLHPVPDEVWRAAVHAQCAQGPIAAVKVGLIGNERLARTVATVLAAGAANVPIVIDPVLSATAGGFTGTAELCAAYREHLLPLAALLTPNYHECDALCGGDIASLLAMGARAVLQKDGHGQGERAIDRLVTRAGEQAFSRARHAVGPVRGTGCALSSAIAAHLARGANLASAVERAGAELNACIAALGPAPDGAIPRQLPLRRWGTQSPA